MYNIHVLQGQKLMMMGTADEVVKAPEKGPVFMEDLPEEEQVVAVVRFMTLSFTTTNWRFSLPSQTLFEFLGGK